MPTDVTNTSVEYSASPTGDVDVVISWAVTVSGHIVTQSNLELWLEFPGLYGYLPGVDITSTPFTRTSGTTFTLSATFTIHPWSPVVIDTSCIKPFANGTAATGGYRAVFVLSPVSEAAAVEKAITRGMRERLSTLVPTVGQDGMVGYVIAPAGGTTPDFRLAAGQRANDTRGTDGSITTPWYDRVDTAPQYQAGYEILAIASRYQGAYARASTESDVAWKWTAFNYAIQAVSVIITVIATHGILQNIQVQQWVPTDAAGHMEQALAPLQQPWGTQVSHYTVAGGVATAVPKAAATSFLGRLAQNVICAGIYEVTKEVVEELVLENLVSSIAMSRFGASPEEAETWGEAFWYGVEAVEGAISALTGSVNVWRNNRAAAQQLHLDVAAQQLAVVEAQSLATADDIAIEANVPWERRFEAGHVYERDGRNVEALARIATSLDGNMRRAYEASLHRLETAAKMARLVDAARQGRAQLVATAQQYGWDVRGSVKFKEFTAIGTREAEFVFARLLVGHVKDVLAALPVGERYWLTLDEFLKDPATLALLGVPEGFTIDALRLQSAAGETVRGVALAAMSLEDVLAQVERGGKLTLQDPDVNDPKNIGRLVTRRMQLLDKVLGIGNQRQIWEHVGALLYLDASESMYTIILRKMEKTKFLDSAHPERSAILRVLQQSGVDINQAINMRVSVDPTLVALLKLRHEGFTKLAQTGDYKGLVAALEKYKISVEASLLEASGLHKKVKEVQKSVQLQLVEQQQLGVFAGRPIREQRETFTGFPIDLTQNRPLFTELAVYEILEDGAASFRASLRQAIFEYSIVYSDSFARQIMARASRSRILNQKDSGQLFGALLEILQIEVVRAEADLLETLKRGTTEMKDAYKALVAEIFNDQDVSVLDNLSPNEYRWIGDSTYNKNREDARLAAVRLDKNNNPMAASVLSKIYECKSFSDDGLFETENMGHAARETVSRGVQDRIVNGFEGQTAEVQFVINQMGTPDARGRFWNGLWVPRPLNTMFNELATLHAFESSGIHVIPAEYLIYSEGAPIARIVLRDSAGNLVNPFTITPASIVSNHHSAVIIEFEYQRILGKDAAGRVIWANPQDMRVAVSWDPTPSRASCGATQFVDWLIANSGHF